jgi:S-adenosylmethionine hydrolase
MINTAEPMLVFMTDFGTRETSVAAMHGVVKSVDRRIEIIEATHELPPFDIWTASFRLNQMLRFWPEGTVFVAVVDPGVGTFRRACVARTADGYYITTPDNGSLTHVWKEHGIAEVREIDETVNRLRGRDTEETSVFHGRDLFGFCAAKLASGKITYEEVGPAYDPGKIVLLDIPAPVYEDQGAQGIIEIDDPNFGNLFTNISARELLKRGFHYGETVHVEIFQNEQKKLDLHLPFVAAFGMAAKGEPLLYNNELMHVSLACAQGNFAGRYKIGFGRDWKVKLSRE